MEQGSKPPAWLSCRFFLPSASSAAPFSVSLIFFLCKRGTLTMLPSFRRRPPAGLSGEKDRLPLPPSELIAQHVKEGPVWRSNEGNSHI